MRIVIISDKDAASAKLEAALERRGYTPILVTPETPPARVLSADPHLVIVLSSSAHGNIVAELRRLRDDGCDAPILTITRTFGAEQRVALFNAGADHLVFQPVDGQELMARINAMLRRAQNLGQTRFRNGPLELDMKARTVRANGELVELSRKEYQLIEVLITRRGRPVSRDAIMDYLYSGMDEPDMKILDVYMCKLRAKLAQVTGRRDLIETRHGFGFSMPALVYDRPRAAA